MAALFQHQSSAPSPARAALSLKRSRLDFEPADDEGVEHREFAPPAAPLADLKRSKTQGDADDISIISAKDAWIVDVDSILASPTTSRKAHSNAAKYVKGESIVVLCLQGDLHLHYDLLWAMLPELYALSPSLQALVLCRDPSTHVPSTTVPHSLPLVQGAEGSVNHFVRLGLLHPAGGGHYPLDALVVIDGRGRRRLVLPFGWGAGRHAATPAGRGVQKMLMGMLRQCVEALLLEEYKSHAGTQFG